MALRLSALDLGKLPPAARKQLGADAGRLTQGRPKTSRKKASAIGAKVCPIDGDTLQSQLWRRVCTRWPGRARWEYRPFSQRKFTLDIAFPHEKLAIEVDGWQYHGKYKSGFWRDREKRNLLAIEGWQLLAFPATQIRSEPLVVMAIVGEMLAKLSESAPEEGSFERGAGARRRKSRKDKGC